MPQCLQLTLRLSVLLILTTPQWAASSGAPVGTDFQVNVNTTSDPFFQSVAVQDDGSFVVAWEAINTDGDGTAIAARFFSDDDVGGSEIVVNTGTTFDQEDPDVAALVDGTFVVVWDTDPPESPRDIFGQRLDSAGQKVGDEFMISTSATGDDNDAVVAPLAGGGFLVVWELNGGPPADEDLWGRRFDSNGSPVGAPFMINEVTLSDQEDADIASDSNGNFVVVWESYAQDGSEDGVFGRRLDSTGQPVGGEFSVNEMTAGTQKNPFLGVRSDGVFAVVWNDEAVAPEDDQVWLRIFDADGTPRTGDIAVATQVVSEDRARVGFNSLGQATVTWEGDDSMTGNLNMWYRSFEDSGAPAEGPEAVLSSISQGSQYAADLDFGPGGHGVAAWLSSHTGPWQLFARRFPAGVVFCDGFESGGTEAWSSTVP